jgi:hypothetical protein
MHKRKKPYPEKQIFQGSSNGYHNPNYLHPSAPLSFLTNNSNDKKYAKKQIIISNLREQLGDYTSCITADVISVCQILNDIKVPLNITAVTRIGTFDSSENPRQIVVRFETKKCRETAICNAYQLQNFTKWKHILLTSYSDDSDETSNKDNKV